MAAVTICSDFGAPKNKVWHCFYCFSIYFPYIAIYLHTCIFAGTCLIYMETSYFLQMCSTIYKTPTALVCIIAMDWPTLFDSYFVCYWTGYHEHWYSYWNRREGGKARPLKNDMGLGHNINWWEPNGSKTAGKSTRLDLNAQNKPTANTSAS